jgi:hypothetical protein
MMGKLLSVFALGMTGLWQGIPLGFVLKLPPVLTGLLAGLGSLVATVIVMLLGERLRNRLARPRAATGAGGERLIERVWRRYGVVGLGLLAPFLTGAPVGAALGLFLRVPAGRLLFWLVLGVALWAVVLTGAGVYGSAGVRRLLGG